MLENLASTWMLLAASCSVRLLARWHMLVTKSAQHACSVSKLANVSPYLCLLSQCGGKLTPVNCIFSIDLALGNRRKISWTPASSSLSKRGKLNGYGPVHVVHSLHAMLAAQQNKMHPSRKSPIALHSLDTQNGCLAVSGSAKGNSLGPKKEARNRRHSC